MKTFQQPLNSNEEAFYIRLLREEGDSEAGKKARDILIERNLRLVAHVAKKYQNVEESMEELISIGTIGLIKAVSTFDAEKGNRLAAYAARCIDNELLMMLRVRKKTSREISLYEPIGTDREGNEINLLDIIEGKQIDVVEQMELQERLQQLSALLEQRLSSREREVICMRYGLVGGEEMTQRQVGEVLRISRSYVSRIEKRALLKLRDGFEHT